MFQDIAKDIAQRSADAAAACLSAEDFTSVLEGLGVPREQAQAELKAWTRQLVGLAPASTVRG